MSSMSVAKRAEKMDAQTAGICLSCGRPLTRRGPAGECLRCLVSLAFLPDGEPSGEGITRRRRVAPGPLSYAHFEVEVGRGRFSGRAWSGGDGRNLSSSGHDLALRRRA